MISVIIPIYNTKKEYLIKCLDSVFNQSDNNYEVIIIDDGSNISTKRIIDKYKKFDNALIIHKKNSGVSNSRNLGIKKAKGDYIIFIDSDDYIEKDTIKNINSYIKKYKSDIYIYPLYIDYKNKLKDNIFFEGTKEYLDKEKLLLELIEPKYFNITKQDLPLSIICPKVFKKDIIKNIKFENCSMMEDLIFNLYAFQNSEKISYIDCKFYYRVNNSSSVTQRNNKNVYKEYERNFNYIEKFIDKFNKDNSFRKCLSLRKVISFNYYIRYNAPDNDIINLVDYYKGDFDVLKYVRLGLYQRVFLFFIRYKFIKISRLLYRIKIIIKNNKNY